MNKLLEETIDIAIREDLGDGDHSSLSCIPESALGKAQLIIKQNGIIAGISIAEKIAKKIDANLNFDIFINDGDIVRKKDVAFIISGKIHSILQAERLILNVMQRMSGIATNTNMYVKKIKKLHTKILDTRKTTPGFRTFEKEAVKIGGGINHRMGLFDMIMLKDNHIDFAGGIEQALTKTKEYLKSQNKSLKIIVEVRNLSDINKVVRTGVADRLLLDNFTPKLTKKAVKLINGRFETESSGGINLKTIRKYAKTGVDYISVGALTHHIKSLDMSLKAYF